MGEPLDAVKPPEPGCPAMLTPDNATFIKSLASASPDIILVADIKPSERPPVATPRAALR